MVSFIVRMRFAAEDRENVSDILRQLALASRQEPGCVSYVPHTAEDDPSMVVISEREVSRAANGKPQKGLTPSEKPSPRGDKTRSGTTTCAMLDLSLIQPGRVLGSCDTEKLTAA